MLDGLLLGYRFVWQNWKLPRELFIFFGIKSVLMCQSMVVGNAVIALDNKKEGPVLTLKT